MHTISEEARQFSPEQIEQALERGGEHNKLVTDELVRLLEDLAENCANLIQAGKNPDELLTRPPSCALEERALKMLAEAVSKAKAAK